MGWSQLILWFLTHLVSLPSFWGFFRVVPITTDITITLLFFCFYSSLARSKYLSLFSLKDSLVSWFSFFCWQLLGLVFQVIFLFFLSSPLVWWCPFLVFFGTCKFIFQQAFWFFLDLAVLCLLLFVSSLLIISMAHLSMLNSIPIP